MNTQTNPNQDIIPNQELTFIHIKLQDDLAYQHSLQNNDVFNMKLVLRAWGFSFDTESAEKQVAFGLTF